MRRVARHFHSGAARARDSVLREFQIRKWNFYLFKNVIIILVVNVYIQYYILISVVCQTSSF